MSWDPRMEVQYMNINYPYNTAGGFMEYFEDLTYQHANFIFDGASYLQGPVRSVIKSLQAEEATQQAAAVSS